MRMPGQGDDRMETDHSTTDVKSSVIPLLILTALTLAVYWPVRDFEFVNYDDTGYVTKNRSVRMGLSAESLKGAFTETFVAHWQPLTAISLMADAELYGIHPGGFHLTSLMLHLVGALLLFMLLRDLTGRVGPSLFVAAIFAVHPFHAESVAWISERKDVLSGVFFFLCLRVYQRFSVSKNVRDYLLLIALFACALMSKVMVATLPCVLLLLDVWPLRRIELPWARRDDSKTGDVPYFKQVLLLCAEKIPLFVLGVGGIALAFVTQGKEGVVRDFGDYSLIVRGGTACIAYMLYIIKSIVPTGLAFYYPHIGDNLPMGLAALSFGALAVTTALVLWRSGRSPYLFTGWFWFLGMLVPVIGIVQLGDQFMADRYTYLPQIGLLIMVAWGCVRLLERRPGAAKAVTAAAVIFVVVMSVWGRVQVETWRDSRALFYRALEVTENNYIAHNNLAMVLIDEGEPAEAQRHLELAVEIQPTFAYAFNNLGLALEAQGYTERAWAAYAHALELRPGLNETRLNQAIFLAREGRYDEAREIFESLLAIDYDRPNTLSNFGGLLLTMGNAPEAIVMYSEALALSPMSGLIHYNLGNAYLKVGDLDRAVKFLTISTQLELNSPQNLYVLALAHAQRGEIEEAARILRKVVELDPGHAKALENLRNIESSVEGSP